MLIFSQQATNKGGLRCLCLLSSCVYLIKFGEVDIMQAELTRQFPDALNRVEVRSIKTAESRVYPHPTDSQRVSKNPLTSPAYTVEVDLYRPAMRSTSFG